MKADAVASRLLAGDFTSLLVQGDCIDVLKQLPDDIIDLTITDPSYESLERHRAKGTTTRLKDSRASSNPWFTPFPNARYGELFGQLYRVHRDNTHAYVFCDSETEHILLTGHNPYLKQPPVCPVVQAGWRAWPTLTWLKTKNAVSTSKDVEVDLTDDDLRSGMGYHWRRTEERIVFLEKGRRKLANLAWPNVFVGPRAGKHQFPTEKPENIIEKLILNSTNAGDVVLDTFAGSGVVGRVATKLGRRTILVDMNTSWILDRPIAGMEVCR